MLGVGMERRLAAIMVADIVGYSALMEEAEEHTADRVSRCREKVASLGGRILPWIRAPTVSKSLTTDT